jgi:hypothetical protein
MTEMFGFIGFPGLLEILMYLVMILTGLICAINAFIAALKLEHV